MRRLTARMMLGILQLVDFGVMFRAHPAEARLVGRAFAG